MSEQRDNLKETLSALMDGEVDDLEFRRVLKAVAVENVSGSLKLKDTWHRYHLISTALNSKEKVLSCSASFLTNIQAGISQDPIPVRHKPDMSGQKAKKRWALAFGQGAIAASVAALVLVVSFGVISPEQEQVPELADSAPASDIGFQMAENVVLESGDFNQLVNLSGELDAQSHDRLRQAVYREFEQNPESLQLPVRFQIEER